MSTRWITQPRDRKSKKYLALHAELRREVEASKPSGPDKRERKLKRSAEYRAGQL